MITSISNKCPPQMSIAFRPNAPSHSQRFCHTLAGTTGMLPTRFYGNACANVYPTPARSYFNPNTHLSSFQHFRKMAAPNPDEMEEFQRLSDRYQPDVEGPLVSQRLPITNIVTEYAHADSTYITKTRALAGTYNAYRRIKGDGQCGWRSTVFGYFELLALGGDVSLLEVEEIRIRSFKDIMVMAGVDYDLLVDMFDNTWELFAEVKKAILENKVGDFVVLQTMNDPVVSESIVYHFKMMTSSFMALHADDFEPFLEMPLDDYRQSRIDPANQEIDQIGLQALTTGVIAPAGIGLEVLYLDRSDGDMVTPHPFVQGAEGKPIIRLLYRPGHYDIIYKTDSNITVLLQNNLQAVRYETAYEPDSVDDMYSAMFPYSSGSSSFIPGPFADSYQPPPPTNHQPFPHHTQYPFLGPGTLDHYDSFNQPLAYSPPALMHASNPYQSSVGSDQPQEYFNIQRQQPSIPSIPTTSQVLPQTILPPPPISPGDPLIRLNSRMLQSDFGQTPTMPLDPRLIRSFSQSQASICNPGFQPEMYEKPPKKGKQQQQQQQ